MSMSANAPRKSILPGWIRKTGWTLFVLIAVLTPFGVMAITVLRIVHDQIVATIVTGLLGLVIIATIRWFGRDALDYRPWMSAMRDTPQFWIWAAGAALLAFLLGQATSIMLYQQFGSPAFDFQSEVRAQAPIALVATLTLVSAPLGEEALFRGIIYPLLRQRISMIASMIVTSILFALMHNNLMQLAATLPLACVLAVVYERSRALWPVIVLHLLFNLAATFIPVAAIAPFANPVTVIAFGALWLYVLVAMFRQVSAAAKIAAARLAATAAQFAQRSAIHPCLRGIATAYPPAKALRRRR